MTSRFECDCCGACCKGKLIVEADYIDVLREPRLLDADVTGRHPTLDELADDDGRCILLAANQACRFLSPDGRCTIYPTRPTDCVGMEAGDEQCQYARSRLDLPPLQPQQPAQSLGQETPRM